METNQEKAARLYLAGQSTNQIAATLRVGNRSVRAMLQSAGVKMRTRSEAHSLLECKKREQDRQHPPCCYFWGDKRSHAMHIKAPTKEHVCLEEKRHAGDHVCWCKERNLSRSWLSSSCKERNH